MKDNSNNKLSNYNNGIVDGVIFCEEEEKKLLHDNKPKSKEGIGKIFRFPDLNE